MVAPKREKMACQRSMNQKKREKGVTMSQKRERERQGMIRERKPLPQGVSRIHPSIHPSTHTHLLIEIA